jgi:hypothetical protein
VIVPSTVIAGIVVVVGIGVGVVVVAVVVKSKNGIYFNNTIYFLVPYLLN